MPDDTPTIGLLCKEKNSIEAEFALRDMTKPIGVSEYIIAENLPDSPYRQHRKKIKIKK